MNLPPEIWSLIFHKVLKKHIIIFLGFVHENNPPTTNKELRIAAQNYDLLSILIIPKLNHLDWDNGLMGAAECNHPDLFKYSFRKKVHPHWDVIIRYICKGGSKNILDFFINEFDKRAEDFKKRNICSGNSFGELDFNQGLLGACRSGNMEIVKIMIKKGASYWNYSLYQACKGNHSEVIKLLITKGAMKCGYCDRNLDEHLLTH